MASSLTRKLPTIIGALLLAATLFTAYTATGAQADHEPANKAAATGSDLQHVDEAVPLLSETMRVSSPEDAIISVSAECSIITELITDNTTNSSTAFGSVRLWVTIDGKRVSLSTDDTAVDDDDQEDVDGDGISTDPSDVGEVTFCNRAYSRTVTDEETNTPKDGIDKEDDYIRTRAANAFNWLALNLGTTYDADGDNVINVVLWADYDVSEAGNAVADAFVGSRTMIIEPTSVSNHEMVNATGVEAPGNGNKP